MASIVRELQGEALNPQISVADLLRKAKVVAKKLNLSDFEEWVNKELGGYGEDEPPGYRTVHGEIKGWNPYRGWIPVQFENTRDTEILSRRGLSQSIGELEDLKRTTKGGMLFMDYPTEIKKLIQDGIEMQTDVKLMFGRNALVGIIDTVRTRVLDWSLDLEKQGVLGDGLTFSDEERLKAEKINTTYNIANFAGVIGPVSGNAEVEVKQINIDSKEELKGLIAQIREYAPQILLEGAQRNSLDKELEIVDKELDNEEIEPSRVRTALTSVKNIFEGVAGNVIAQGIIMGIQKYLLQ